MTGKCVVGRRRPRWAWKEAYWKLLVWAILHPFSNVTTSAGNLRRRPDDANSDVQSHSLL